VWSTRTYIRVEVEEQALEESAAGPYSYLVEYIRKMLLDGVL
jgi:hypothetical protein